MANFFYDNALLLLSNGGLDLVNDDIRFLMAMTNTTADTEKDKLTISGFTTLDEADGAGYARKTLSGQAATVDNANHRSEVDCDDVPWASIGAGTRQYQGIVAFKFVTNDSDSIPVAWIDSGGFPFNGNGSPVTAQINADGFAQIRAA